MSMRWTQTPLKAVGLAGPLVFLLESVDGMYMELVFSHLSQAICLILPAVFTAITRLLLASVQFKPILRRAVGCLPEPLYEHSKIFLPVLVTKMLCHSLLCPWFPCRTSRGRARGLTSVCFAGGTRVCGL